MQTIAPGLKARSSMKTLTTLPLRAAILACATLAGATLAGAKAAAAGSSAQASSAPALRESAPERCNAIAAAMRGHWPDGTTRILAAAWRADGWRVMTRTGPVTLPGHCEITAALHERIGRYGQHYAIRFHLRLPRRWNDRFFFEGGGGSEGDLGDALGTIAVGIAGVPPAVDDGYAVVSEDSGHDNAVNTDVNRGGAVAFGLDPQARADYGGASLEPVAEAAKAVLRIFYGRAPSRSYFVGCSKGGQEGMVFAQRDPKEFDGIVAGAPGFSLPRAAVAEAWDTQAFASLLRPSNEGHLDPRGLPGTFSRAQFALVREAILAACDADDGVRDGITADFEACAWSRVRPQLESKRCPAQAAGACLSEAQIDVLARVYGGPKNGAGQALYASWPLDAGAGSDAWRIWKIGPAAGGFPGINVALGAPALAEIFTTPPTVLPADPQSALDYVLRFNFDRDAPKIYATGGAFDRSAWDQIAARSPRLEAFHARGGKMIVAQGASDPAFSLNDTLAWYREVDRRNGGKASSFVRVFPVPGMAHCAGGPATDEFNVFAALVRWVEQGKPPDRILAKAGAGTPWPGRTRPLCAYPKIARYSGTGSIEKASSFRCE